MGRPKKVKPSESHMDKVLKNTEPENLSLNEMPLETIRDYRLYNEEARRLNKKLKFCRYPIKQCPVELHPTEEVVFSRKDQPTNPLHVLLSDEKIHFEKVLVPGKTYNLPKYVVAYLQNKGKAIWDWIEKPDGSKETKIVDKDYRFSLKTVYTDYE